MSNNTKKYIVDVCNYIDFMWSIAFIVLFIRCLWHAGDGWEYALFAFIGVLVFPAKEYWAKWLQLDVLPKNSALDVLIETGYRVTDVVNGEENKILVFLEKEK